MVPMAMRSPRDLSRSIRGFLSQGTTPGKLGFTVALGMALSCFPVFGATTILCAVIAVVFRLNLPAIEAGNYLALPLQFVLLVPFLRMGERIFHSPRLPLVPSTLISMLRGDPDGTMRLLMADQGHAILAWALVAPGLLLVFSLLLIPLLRWVLGRIGSQPGVEVTRPAR